MSRTKKAVKNTLVGLICTGISYALSFFLQALFIRLLGLEYSGVNSLFTNILKILNIADLGFNNAILFKIYKTIANEDDDATEMYLTLYRKICYVVGAVIAAGGACCIPFLGDLINGDVTLREPLWSLYIIVLGTSVANQVFNYKSVLIIAKQDRYICTILEYSCIFIKHVLQIVVLLAIKNIYLYLLIELVVTIFKGLITGIVSKRKYKLSAHSKRKITKEESKDITKDIGTLAVFKLCRTTNSTLDTFLISKFISVSQTAIYGSTTILTDGLGTLISTINDGMIAGVGNQNAVDDIDGVEHTLKMSVHIMYLLYGICAAVLIPFMSMFMNWWIGYTLPDICIYALVLIFYCNGINSNIATYRNSMGLYRKGWKRTIATVVVNFAASLILIQRIGILGAFLGTIIANFLTVYWYDIYIIFKFGLKRTAKTFYLTYAMYLAIVITASVITKVICTFLPIATSLLSLIGHGLLYTTVSAIILIGAGFAFPIQKDVIRQISQVILKKRKKQVRCDL